MKLSFLANVALAVGVAYAAVATNFSAAEWKKYHCLTLERYLEKLIVPCTYNCLAFILDGHIDDCPPDDMVCHCARSQILIDQGLGPCLFNPASPNATCSQSEIGQGIDIVIDLCTFYNATQYADYIGCSPKLTLEIAEGIAHGSLGPQKTN